jgi:hypothetical protein
VTCHPYKKQLNVYSMYTDLEGILSVCFCLQVSISPGVVKCVDMFFHLINGHLEQKLIKDVTICEPS